MKILFVVFAHILATFAKLLRPSGAKALITEKLLLKEHVHGEFQIKQPRMFGKGRCIVIATWNFSIQLGHVAIFSA